MDDNPCKAYVTTLLESSNHTRQVRLINKTPVLLDQSKFQDENGEELMDVESVLRKGEEAFKLADFQSAYNIYTFGIEKVR